MVEQAGFVQPGPKVFHAQLRGAPIAQLGEHQTLDHKVAGSILTGGAVLCP